MGGGIRSEAILTLTAVTISNNVAGTGGGAYIGIGATADDATVVSGNSTHDGGTGGGVAIEDAVWRYGTIEDNTATYGGGVALLSEGELRNATVQGNRATVSGGGVWMEDVDTAVHDSTISSNTSDGVGGGIGTEARDTMSSEAALLANVAITSNTAAVAGGGARVEMNLESEQSDWGTGATENVPDDVSLYWDEAEEVTYDGFGATEDFVCAVRDSVCE